jgi:hypothetical protein
MLSNIRPPPIFNDWTGFHAAHVFPLEKESLFLSLHYERHVEGDTMEKPHQPIDSCKNGVLIKADLHLAFDKYLISINPDVSDFTISFASY